MAAADSDAPRAPRLIKDGLLASDQCTRLINVHRALSVPGYRENLTATCFRELFATGAYEHILEFAQVRDLIRDAVESAFGEEEGLFFEFTGIMCWSTGSFIQSHCDDNRDYLKQRHYSAVLYLNSPDSADEHGGGFTGGEFVFEDAGAGGEVQVQPQMGRLLMFASDGRNMHHVNPVHSGERYTFTIWFTRSAEHSQDGSTLGQLGVLFADGQVCVPHKTQVDRLIALGLVGCPAPARPAVPHTDVASVGWFLTESGRRVMECIRAASGGDSPVLYSGPDGAGSFDFDASASALLRVLTTALNEAPAVCRPAAGLAPPGTTTPTTPDWAVQALDAGSLLRAVPQWQAHRRRMKELCQSQLARWVNAGSLYFPDS